MIKSILKLAVKMDPDIEDHERGNFLNEIDRAPTFGLIMTPIKTGKVLGIALLLISSMALVNVLKYCSGEQNEK